MANTTTVGSRELKTRLGAYLRKVRSGRTLVVTDRGEPVAELRPLPPASGVAAELLRLAADGGLTLPARAHLGAFSAARHEGPALSQAIAEGRRDRF